MKKFIVGIFILLCTVTSLLSITFTVPQRWEHPQALAGSRQSSYPYISGDTFRAASDFIIDEKYIPFDPERVKHGDTIFVSAEHLDFYFNTIHPHIRNSYILITHNSDISVPGKWQQYLNDPTIIAWFGQNYDGTVHEKFFPIPIGLANKHWGHGNTDLIDQVRDQNKNSSKKYLAYLNFVDGTNHAKRSLVRDFFKNKPFCFSSPLKPYKDYLKDLAQSIFVICPEGNGLDCHRTWEALLMGSIPVMLHSSLDPLLEGLPVLLINDWKDVTEEFLIRSYNSMRSKTFVTEKMFASYWFTQIQRIKEEIKKKRTHPKFKFITVLYNEKNHDRMQEYMTCLKKNCGHNSFDTIHVVYDTSQDDDNPILLKWLQTLDITMSYTDSRPTYGFLFDLANSCYPDSPIVLSNADIYFNETLSSLENYDLTHKFLALTRWNVCSDGTLEIFKQYHNGLFDKGNSETSQDVWIFKTPLRKFNDDTIKIGTMTCDSLIAYEAFTAGLELVNPCLTIQCCHLHLSNIRNYEANQTFGERPYKRVPWSTLS